MENKGIMDIENMQNQLFSERKEEFLKDFNTKKMSMNNGFLRI